MDKHETAKNLMFSLAQVAQFARQNLFSDNLSQSEYLIGSVMYESKKPAMSMTELMARTQMSAPALSRFLSRMEERGYAVRFHDEDNKKNVLVALTDAAREKNRHAQGAEHSSDGRFCGQIFAFGQPDADKADRQNCEYEIKIYILGGLKNVAIKKHREGL